MEPGADFMSSNIGQIINPNNTDADYSNLSSTQPCKIDDASETLEKNHFNDEESNDRNDQFVRNSANGDGDGGAGEGSDSGVEICTTTNATGTTTINLTIQKNIETSVLQRTFSSSNSGGYTSSCCGGLDEQIIGGNLSCNSSMISFCSDTCNNNLNKNNINDNKIIDPILRENSQNDCCTSEGGGSESSSVTNGRGRDGDNRQPISKSTATTPIRRSFSTVRKKVALNESSSNIRTKKSIENPINISSQIRSRPHTSYTSRTASITDGKSTENTPNRINERTTSKDKLSSVKSTVTLSKTPPPQGRSTPIKKPLKPNSLPNGLKDVNSSPIINSQQQQTQRSSGSSTLTRTPSLSRSIISGRFTSSSSNCTPIKSEDTRWPTGNASGKINRLNLSSSGAYSLGYNNEYDSGGGSCNGGRQTPDTLVIKTKIGPITLDHKSTFDKYGTLPRRRKEKSNDELEKLQHQRQQHLIRSHSVTRNSSIAKESDPRSTIVNGKKHQLNESPSNNKCHPFLLKSSRKKNYIKTKIYHETAQQTVITCKDIDEIFTGSSNRLQVNTKDINAIEMSNQSCQVDIRDRQMENLEEKLDKITGENLMLQKELTDRSQLIINMEQQLSREHDEKLALQRELQSNTQRILTMLELVNRSVTPTTTTIGTTSNIHPFIVPSGYGNMESPLPPTTPGSSVSNDVFYASPCAVTSTNHQHHYHQQLTSNDNVTPNTDSLFMLESQIQMSGHVLEEKQSEIDTLRSFCHKLQIEMKRSLSVQQYLLEEKEESSELQDFLQNEKSALVEALKDTEHENEQYKIKLTLHESDIERLQEERRHLVRISEQRRQEYLGMKSKYTALESRSKDLIVQQGTAVSGASMALANLGERLDKLVEQLILSYNISDQELEDVIYHNEAYTNSCSSNSSSGDGDEIRQIGYGEHEQNECKSITSKANNNENNIINQKQYNVNIATALSPQRHQSFIAAVINAIKNATSTTNTLKNSNNNNNNHLITQNLMKPSINNNSISIAGTTRNTNNNNVHYDIDNVCDNSDSTDMLDSETEPCMLMLENDSCGGILMMENVLENVQMPDTHSYNMISSTKLMSTSQQKHKLSTEINSEIQQQFIEKDYQANIECNSIDNRRDEETIDNLSQAIVNRQQIELQTNLLIRHNSDHSTSDDISGNESVVDIPSISEYCSAQALVDQVIDVDNLVTKLLKVLRIIQIDNDNCIQQLIGEKNKLQLNKEEIREKLNEYEILNKKLENAFQDASHQLIVNGTDLANSKIELQRYRNEIDKLNVDICNLSTLCSNQNKVTKQLNKDDIIETIKLWHENGTIPETEIVSHILSVCKEIPILREKLIVNNEKTMATPQFLMANWKDAIVESKKQYDSIDRALEILNSVQSIVSKYPQLIELQRNLEETNFNSTTTLPIYSALLASISPTSVTTNTTSTTEMNNDKKNNINNNSNKNLSQDFDVNESVGSITDNNVSVTLSPTKTIVDLTA